MQQRKLARHAGALLLGALAFVPMARAEGPEHIKVSITAQKEVTVVDKSGVTKVELVEPAKVLPGDEIVYNITYANTGGDPTNKVVVTNKIPAQMTYVRDTAEGANTKILFSADGAAFVPREQVMVRTPEGEMRPATEKELTHIRWVVNAAVMPGEAGTVSYRARVQ